MKVSKGDFTGLAEKYSKNRPDYSASVLKSLLALVDKPINDIDFVDVGAGTGIWTRMVREAGVKSVIAVEPNDDMRRVGITDTVKNTKLSDVIWISGSGENTGLLSNSCDLVSMASSFHWADFDKATKEFHRILKENGRFVALWNPRLIENNPLLVEIEDYLTFLKKDIKRVSSGRSGITDVLTERLNESIYFDDVIYIEGRHSVYMTPERYLGAWHSVNDLQAQLGSKLFEDFIKFIENKVKGLDFIEADYFTRAWSARKVV
ncbi:methyltransferase domain-containing protein [Aeromonas bestiarum]|uniref:Methyltransferase domain-containing protein n=1 Tax=Aeromonas bestiarum TaxID=105751 RepID=A0AAW7HX57_9GAMM|nr:methyltransferase domain-containing protein [Aeromonas bestiarum]MDM5138390.1 methyltransferase domain-containing protein [Aeromonas bestiarum]POG22880.1 methyltransferase domain-containing protein [Aeromonas bestiarum]